MKEQSRPQPIDCVAVCVVRSYGPFGGYVTHELKLTEDDLKRLSVSSTEPEIIGCVAADVENRILRWVDR